MKTYYFRLLWCIMIALFLTTINYAQGTDKATVTMIVDLANLGSDPGNPGGITFEVDSGTSAFNLSDPKEFTIHVLNGTKVKWKGKTTSGEKVRILRIRFLKGINVFNKEKVRRCLFGRKVSRRVKRQTGDGPDHYTYEIKFRPKKMQRYYLDPKIQVE